MERDTRDVATANPTHRKQSAATVASTILDGLVEITRYELDPSRSGAFNARIVTGDQSTYKHGW